MAISKKPIKSKIDEKSVKNLIEKGGSVAEKETNSQSEITKLQLRLHPSLVEIIDGLRKKRLTKVSRHSWFLEAIEAKIKSEREE